MKIYKPKFWGKKNNIYSLLLYPFSILLVVVNFLRKITYKEEKFSIPIICIGNIYVGGTGKTPLAIKITQILLKIGKKPVIVRKFYPKHIDETNLIQKNKIDLITNKSRNKGIHQAIEDGYDIVILDDGFQDYKIFKDLNILCINEKLGFGNEMIIPSGPLRESLKSIKNCNIVLINGNINSELESKIKKFSKNTNIYYSKYIPIKFEAFKKNNLLAFAGIGDPESFFKLLKLNGLNIEKKYNFPDHYNYSLKELKDIINEAKDSNLKIVTTEKDYCRIKNLNLEQINYIPIKLEISEYKSFSNDIINYIK